MKVTVKENSVQAIIGSGRKTAEMSAYGYTIAVYKYKGEQAFALTGPTISIFEFFDSFEKTLNALLYHSGKV